MSDAESDYYSDSSESEDEPETTNLKVVKKPIVINAAKKFGNYIEDESDIDDSEPDDADANDDADEDEDEEEDEKIGGKPKLITKEVEDDAEPEEDEEDENEDSDIEIDEEGQVVDKSKTTKPIKTSQLIIQDDDDDNDNDDEYEENYLQKFDNDLNKNYITEFHPECLNHNSDEVAKLSKIIRDENNIIIDPLHRTIPYLTKYEKARVLGQRAKQIETGAKPLVKVPENIIDGYLIAELELREKRIPFIIKRPIPGGAFEYWNIRDLENILF
jgi:DNA-directed RNA polymerase I, II, and III subunit RPABC2